MTNDNFTSNIDLDSLDIATGKISQLDAMLTTITGEGFEHFKNMADDAQQSYLWAISGLAQDIKAAINH